MYISITLPLLLSLLGLNSYCPFLPSWAGQLRTVLRNVFWSIEDGMGSSETCRRCDWDLSACAQEGEIARAI